VLRETVVVLEGIAAPVSYNVLKSIWYWEAEEEIFSTKG
jgi:hypothetical protein